MLKWVFNTRPGRAAAGTILALSLPLLFIGASLDLMVNSGWLYSYNWWRNGIPEQTSIRKSELDRAARTIKAYFAAAQPDGPLDVKVDVGGIDASLYTEREVQHMQDVRTLVRGFLAAGLWSGVAVLVVAGAALVSLRGQAWAFLASVARGSAIATVIAVVVIGAASLINFGAVFTLFHQLGFSNNLWQLDYSDYLLLMFPERFWFEATLLLGALIVVEFAALWLATRWLRDRHAPRRAG